MKCIGKRATAWLCTLALLVSCFVGIPVLAAEEEAVNLLLKRPAVATHEQTGSYMGYASNAVDGDYTTRWSSSGGPALPQGVQVDMGVTCEVEQVVSYWFGDNRIFTYNVYVTNEPILVDAKLQTNGVTAVVVGATATGKGGDGDGGSLANTLALPAGTKGRYLTLEVTATSAGNNTAVFWEMEAYGTRLGEMALPIITGVEDFSDMHVPYGTAMTELKLPSEASVNLNDQSTATVPLEWSCADYDPSKAGTYTFTGTPVIGEGAKLDNANGLTSTLKVIVAEADATADGRREYSINAGWKFIKGNVSGGQGVNLDDSKWENVNVPHTWNALDGQDGGSYYRGKGWYRKTVKWNEDFKDHRVYIEFLGVCLQASVYVNGKLAGTHKGGYTAFRVDITDYLVEGEDALIAVMADNSRVEEIAPLSGDFTVFGGMYRDVTLVVTDGVHVDLMDSGSSGLKLTTDNRQVSEKSAELNIQSTIVNDTDAEKQITVQAVLKDPDSFEAIEGIDPLFDIDTMYGGDFKMGVQQTFTIPAGEQVTFSKDLTVENPRLWNGLSDPYRYQVDLTVLEGEKVIDNVTDYVGFRYFNVDYDEGFFLNGKSYPLRGVSRHQDREDMGYAITKKEHDEDFAIIYEMGCNTVRLAHYPQDPYFYELCDKYGIVVWAEIPWVNEIGGKGTYDDPNPYRNAFFEVTRRQLVELIRQQYNRPSIMFWGLQNENLRWGKGDMEVVQAFMADLNALAHKEDPTGRLTTQATDKAEGQQWESDLLAWNSYPGWYYGEHYNLGPDFDTRHAADSRPIGISEYGIGASIDMHVDEATTSHPQGNVEFQSEEYQSFCNESFIKQINERPYFWATYIWNMFDFSSDDRSEGGQLGVNTKGLVTRDRTVKKDSFYLYKANWLQSPTAYIASRRYTERANALNDIRVYSNCEQVELFVNGKSVGTLKQSDLAQQTVFVWEDVRLSSGENTVEIKATLDGKVYTDSVVWNKQAGSGVDIQSQTLTVDAERRVVELDKNYTVEELHKLIVSASNASFKVYQADGKTEVTDTVTPGMLLVVTSEDGSATAQYSITEGNIAKGKPITASSYQDKDDGVLPPTLANDGDLTTRWAAGFDANGVTSYPQWVMVDLGAQYNLSRIDISWYKGGSGTRRYFYTISVSDRADGEFTTVVDRSANADSGVASDALSDVRGRFVRVEITGNNEWPGNNVAAATFYEISVYGTAADEVLYDYNGDGVFDMADVMVVKAALVSGESDDAMDVNADGAVDEEDLLLLAKQCFGLKAFGDVELDGHVNVTDIIKLKNLIMSATWTDEELVAGDLNNSGGLDVGDILSVKTIIMSGAAA